MGDSSGGTQTSTSKQEPWASQQPFLEAGFKEAQRQFNTGGPSMYGGSLVAPFSPESRQAMGSQASRAMMGSPVTRGAKDLTMATMGGQYLGGNNPYLDQAYQHAAGRVTDQFNNEIVPGIQSRFSLAGRTGSGAEQDMATRATGQLTDSLSGMAGRMYANAYESERNRMGQAAGQAPGLASTDYADISALQGVGSQREAMGEAQIAEAAARHDFEQNRDINNLNRFMGFIGGNYGGEGTTSQPLYRNQLGGAAGGAMLGSMFGPAGSAMGPLIGAGLGYFGS
jgi:hypothetical protein